MTVLYWRDYFKLAPRAAPLLTAAWLYVANHARMDVPYSALWSLGTDRVLLAAGSRNDLRRIGAAWRAGAAD